jgi:hypothetical protein
MISLSQSTAAPVELTIDGKVLRVRPLTYAARGELEAWMASHIRTRAAAFAAGLGDEDRRAILLDAARRAEGISETSPDAVPILASREGAARVLWLSLRGDHPDLSLDRVRELICDDAALAAAMNAFDAANKLSVDGDDAAKKAAAAETARESPSASTKSAAPSPTAGAGLP